MTNRGGSLALVPLLTGAVLLAPTGAQAAQAADPGAEKVSKAPPSVAHRGAPFRAPENTLPAIRQADVVGADRVEFDVNLTKDNVPVLMHDLRLARTTDGTGFVEWRLHSYVRRLDAGSWFSRLHAGTRVPTQHQAMSLALDRGLRMLVELKGDVTRLEARRVVSGWRALDAFGRAIATSFSRANLRRIRAADERVRTGLITEHRVRPKEARSYGRVVLVRKSEISAGYVKRLHRAGLRVVSWVADGPVAWSRLTKAGVDLIVTRRPGGYEAWASAY